MNEDPDEGFDDDFDDAPDEGDPGLPGLFDDRRHDELATSLRTITAITLAVGVAVVVLVLLLAVR